jgi:nucleoside 2-deoxyribosyltransferase
MLSSIYLTGGTLDAQDVVNQNPEDDWRSFALTRLERYGLKVVNPLALAWESDSKGSPDEISKEVLRSLGLIDQCDAVLANLTRSSYATAMEIFYAHRCGKVVTVIGQTPFSPWVLSHSKARFRNVERAIEYIIEEQPHSAPLNWALQYEALLAERYEQLPPAGEPDYKFIGGDLPVLVVAPHATAFWREGEFEEADVFTGSMAAVLNRLSSAHTLLTNYCCVGDPLFYLETPFRRVFADLVKTGRVGLVLFLLGLSWHESPGLRIYASESAEELAARLKLKLMALEPVSSEIANDHVLPLQRFTEEELQVPSILLRMHKRYRMPRMQEAAFSQLTLALQEFLRESGGELKRSMS